MEAEIPEAVTAVEEVAVIVVEETAAAITAAEEIAAAAAGHIHETLVYCYYSRSAPTPFGSNGYAAVSRRCCYITVWRA